jgi:hypothetical protein
MSRQTRALRYARAVVAAAAIALINLGDARGADTIRIAIQKTGTVAWEIAAMKAFGLDKAADLDIETMELASTDAGKIALEGGSADVIVSDWIWVARERSLGDKLLFTPYSSALGAVMTPRDSPIHSLADRPRARHGPVLRSERARVSAMAARLLSLFALVCLWAAAAHFGDPRRLPGPAAVFAAMDKAAQSGDLFFAIGVTIARVAAAFVLAMALGSALGYAMGRRALVDRLVDPWIVVLLNLPASSSSCSYTSGSASTRRPQSRPWRSTSCRTRR